MKKPKLNNKAYAAAEGDKCPSCLAEDVHSTDELDHCKNVIYQSCRCGTCGARWTDKYTLEGYSMDEEVDEEPPRTPRLVHIS